MSILLLCAALVCAKQTFDKLIVPLLKRSDWKREQEEAE